MRPRRPEGERDAVGAAGHRQCDSQSQITSEDGRQWEAGKEEGEEEGVEEEEEEEEEEQEEEGVR